MNDRDWFESLFIKATSHFGKLQSDKISDWEVGLIKRAIEGNLLSWNEHHVHVSNTKKPYSLFTMNREYLIQFAAYASLVYEYGYPSGNCLIEYHSMDILVIKNEKPYICVETKVTDNSINKLVEKIKEYSKEVKPVPMNTKNDPQQKANYLFNDKPDFFWVLNDKKKLAFSVTHNETGFDLLPINDIPKYEE